MDKNTCPCCRRQVRPEEDSRALALRQTLDSFFSHPSGTPILTTFPDRPNMGFHYWPTPSVPSPENPWNVPPPPPTIPGFELNRIHPMNHPAWLPQNRTQLFHFDQVTVTPSDYPRDSSASRFSSDRLGYPMTSNHINGTTGIEGAPRIHMRQ